MSDESPSDERLAGSDDREEGEQRELDEDRADDAETREIDEERADDAETRELVEERERGEDVEDGHEPTLSGIFGARGEDAAPRPEVQPESISPESALFVLLGIVLALFVLYRTGAVLVA